MHIINIMYYIMIINFLCFPGIFFVFLMKLSPVCAFCIFTDLKQMFPKGEASLWGASNSFRGGSANGNEKNIILVIKRRSHRLA